MKWGEEELETAIKLVKENKTFLEIAIILNRTQNSVTKKLNRLGYKSGYQIERSIIESKYSRYDWVYIQNMHDNGLSYRDLLKECNLTSHAIIWAKEYGKLIFRNNNEGLKLARKKGKYKQSSKTGIDRYRQLCKFKFSLNDYPNEFDFKLIKKYGWYSPSNSKKPKLNGVSRDHMYSIKEGFKNNVNPYYISHPANCQLLTHDDNNRKKTKCNISLEELIKKIEIWDGIK